MSKTTKSRGLGRGLSALMADVAPQADDEATSPLSDQTSVPIEQVHPNPDQPRKNFDEEGLRDLTASIAEKGIIQPLIVRKDASGYQIVAGERRWRAAQKAKLHKVPVVVRDFSDSEVLEIALIENIQRADLNPIEEAASFRELMDRFGHTQERLAEVIGKSRSHVANQLRLLTLPDKVMEMLRAGSLTSGHARTLVTAEDPESLALKIVKDGLSVRAAEALARKMSEPAKETRTRTAPEKDADTRALEGDLSAALQMGVSLAHKPGSEVGTLTIRYGSLEELDTLCRLLSAT